MKKLLLFWLSGLIGFSLLIVGCSKSTDPNTGGGTLSLTSRYSTTLPPTLRAAKTSSAAAADSIILTRVRFCIRDITFKSDIDSIEYLTRPVVLDLNLASANQELTVGQVPFGTYDRIEFDVHRIESTEVALLPTADQAAFTDFLQDERYSIIIEGTVYRTGQSDTAFVYRSKVDATQKIDLAPPVAISEQNSTANVTMLISSGGWFSSIQGLLDPTDTNNEGVIDENLKSSIRVFKDDNKDGAKDPS